MRTDWHVHTDFENTLKLHKSCLLRDVFKLNNQMQLVGRAAVHCYSISTTWETNLQLN